MVEFFVLEARITANKMIVHCNITFRQEEESALFCKPLMY